MKEVPRTPRNLNSLQRKRKREKKKRKIKKKKKKENKGKTERVERIKRKRENFKVLLNLILMIIRCHAYGALGRIGCKRTVIAFIITLPSGIILGRIFISVEEKNHGLRDALHRCILADSPEETVMNCLQEV